MHVVVIFYDLGGYHAARLAAAQELLSDSGSRLTAIRVVEGTSEQPWGNVETRFPLVTLFPGQIELRRRSVNTLLRSHLVELQPDAVAIPGWGFQFSRAASVWCRENGIPSILMSESKQDDEERKWWKELAKRWMCVQRYDAALVGSSQHQAYLQKLGLPRSCIFHGYDVVDNAHFLQAATQARQDPQAARHRQPKIPERPYFFAATRFIKRKNLPLLLEAYALYFGLAGREAAWDLVIAGSGEEEPAVRAFLRREALEESVHLPGFLPYQAIGDWYGLARAFIHPAMHEQWGLVVNEAMASGLPVLVSNNCGCYPELVIEGVNGFGFSPTDSRQLADLLLRFSNGHIDLDDMGRAALSHIQNFSPEHFALGLVSAVRFAVQGGRNSRVRRTVQQLFENQVDSYRTHFFKKPSGTNHLFRTRLRLACELAARCSGNLLDCATGTGEITGAILSSGNFHSATIVDISSNMLRHAEKQLEANKTRCRMKFVQSDIFDFNRDCSAPKFDLIVCLGLVAHVGHFEELVKHLKNQLSDRGQILCQITLGDHPTTRLVRVLTQQRYFRKHGYRISYYSKTQFEQMCSNAGLHIVTSKRHALGLTFGDRIWAWGNYQGEKLFQPWANRHGAESVYLLAPA